MNETTSTGPADEQRSKLDVLSARHGLTLWVEHEDIADMWGVFGCEPGDEASTDIIGSAGDIDSAIAAAEEQLLAWS